MTDPITTAEHLGYWRRQVRLAFARRHRIPHGRAAVRHALRGLKGWLAALPERERKAARHLLLP